MKGAGDLTLVQDRRGAAAMLDPLRMRILELLRQPDSAAGVARKLRLPRQKINYHMRELEKCRLLEKVEERRKGNCLERIVKATARVYVISPHALGNLATDPEAIQDRFSSTYLVAVAARAIGEMGQLRSQSEKAGKKLATLTLQTEISFASAGKRHAFAEALTRQLSRLTAKYHDEKAKGGRRFRFFVCGYPAISKTKEES